MSALNIPGWTIWCLLLFSLHGIRAMMGGDIRILKCYSSMLTWPSYRNFGRRIFDQLHDVCPLFKV